jgi:hypothetical protein
MLLSLDSPLTGLPVPVGLVAGMGILTKWFPGFILAAVWCFQPRKTALKIGAATLGLTVIVLGGLWLVSPQMTSASLAAQTSRTS